MNKVKAATGVVLGGLTGIGSQIAMGAPAFAGLSDCDAGEVCLYENLRFNEGNTDHIHQWTGDDVNYTGNVWYNNTTNQWSGDDLNDELSSIKNNGTQCGVRVYQDDHHSGYSSFWFRGGSDDDLRSGSPTNQLRDNVATSHKWCA